MTGWMVLITLLLFLAASAVGCYPGRQRTAKHLTAAAGVTMALTGAMSLILKENMFSDALVVPASLWLRAVLAIAVCAGLGILLARLAGGKNKR
ncbi:hypothetical protein ACS3UN_12390 [Oscillospiraceae bacterium LTW-04]|nr:hypothetical protein RBH76_00195 [Oscillospiraceae bacterium MB24-C1]